MKKRLFKIAKNIGIIIFVLLLSGFIYLNMTTYEPMTEARSLLSHDDVEVYDDYYVINPTITVRANVVYYQGGLVESASYLPFAHKLAEQGIRVFIPKMPLNLAILNQDAYQQIKEDNESDLPWIIAGHSLGGASASLFLRSDVAIDGLVLLASYPANNADLSDALYPVLSVRASLDGVLDVTTYEETKSLLPSDTDYRIINGGNHAYFGHYGAQKKDNEATITREEQQDQLVDLIVRFLEETIIGE